MLEKTLADPEVVSDVEGWDLNVFSPMYFVVGLLVTSDITYNSSETSGHNTKVGVDPVNALSLANGVPDNVVIFRHTCLAGKSALSPSEACSN